MTADNLRCAVPSCDLPRVTQRNHSLSALCVRHRYHAPPVQYEPRTCPGCGSGFVPRRSDQLSCSKRCRNRLSARRTYTPRPRMPRRRRRLTCEQCGIDYLAVWGRYCSRKCTNKAWKLHNPAAFRAQRRRYYRRAAAKGAA